MKKILMLMPFLAVSFADAAPNAVMLIADRPVSVSYELDDLHAPSRTGTVELSDYDQGRDFYKGVHYYNNGWATFTALPLAGYDFLGWYTFPKNAGFDDTTVANCSVSLATTAAIASSSYEGKAKTSSDYGDYVLCPKYEEKTFDITFNGDGATSGTMAAVTGKNYDSEFNLPSNGFARTGYAFGGWSNRVGKVFSDGARVKGSDFWNGEKWGFDSELFAKWTNRVYTITFDAGDGQCDVPSKPAVYGDYIGELPTATQYHKKHTGWFSEPSGGRQITRLDRYEWPMDITLFAQYADVEKFDIGADVLPDQDCGSVTGTGSFAAGDQVSLEAIPSEGYGFRDWNDGNSSPKTNFTATGGLKLTAVFTANVYTVTFVSTEGSPREQTKSVTFNETYGEFPTVTAEEDRELEGWYTEAGGRGTRVTPASVVRTAADHDLHANWIDVPIYWIAYDGNGATGGTMPSQKIYCGMPTNLLGNAFVKTGFVFLGWATNKTEAAESKVTFADGAPIGSDLTAAGGSVTLYAVWRELTPAEAMHCTNLVWTSAQDVGTNPWTVQVGPAVGYGPSGSCVRQTGLAVYANQQRLTAEVGTSGTLSFKWRGNRLKILVSKASETSLPAPPNWFTVQGDGQNWGAFTTNIVFETETNVVRILNYGTDGQDAEIDQMNWTPCGPQPGPEDGVTISSAAVSDGKFILSFTSDARFDYNLLTNANLLIDSWGVMTNEVGTGGTIIFAPKIIEGQQQLFYKVETIQRK